MTPAFFILDNGRVRHSLELDRDLEARVEGMGFELVQIEWAGNRTRPILRLRIERTALDRPVSLGDCTEVSRGLEAWLDEDQRLPERYVLEVSSPGVERPLVRTKDFERFLGHQVVVTGKRALCDRGKRLEGELLGFDDAGGEGTLRLRLNGGDEVRVPREQIEGARLVYEWKK